MTRSAQLVLTHGTTDLQILLRDEAGRRWRAVPDKAIVRRFHEWLLAHLDMANVIDTPPELLPREAEVNFTDWQEDTFALWLPDESPEVSPECDPEGRWQIVLPKITPTLNKWFETQVRGEAEAPLASSSFADALQKAGISQAPLQGVLILSTDRCGDPQEPVATATFLRRWLAHKGIAESCIREEIFLHAGERLESGDSPINPAVARSIERALNDFYDRAAHLPLLVASMGGLPPVKPLLAEIAVLLAGSQAQNLFKTEHGVMGLLPQTPIDSLRIRRQCLEQVRRGALLDAWAMAAPLRDDPDSQIWTTPLGQAARLINGNPVGEQVNLPALQTLIDQAGGAACLLVAIRVETALLDERWLDAINGTLTFLEAAFRDAVNAWAEDALTEYRPRDRYMRFKSEPAAFMTEKGNKGGSPALDSWKGRGAGPLAYQANMVGEVALDAWGQLLKVEAVNNLRQTIHSPVKTRFKLADYRNINTHGVMTQLEIDEAVKRFMGANLWSQGVNTPANRPKPGKCFIGRPLVSNVIQHFTGPKTTPLQHYQNLLRQLENTLIDPASNLP